MAELAVALALPGLIDICIKYGNELVEKVELFRNAFQSIKDIQFSFKSIKASINDLLEYFKLRLKGVDESFATELQEWCNVLHVYLEKALHALPSEPGADKLGRIAAKAGYALRTAQKLKAAESNLEHWYTNFLRRASSYKTFKFDAQQEQSFFDAPSTKFSARRIASTVSPGESALKLRLDPLESGGRSKIDGCSLELYTSTAPGEQTHMALEYRSHRDQGSNEINKLGLLVSEIAAKLSQIDPFVTGLLKCDGFSHEPLFERYVLHFSIPAGLEAPKSLRAMLADKSYAGKQSINDRIRLATALASAVLYMHMCGFVHKNIRPENILVFEDTKAAEQGRWPYTIGTPFLVGYDGVRKADAQTEARAVLDWKKRIYLAPDRLRMQNNDPFHMKHDVYSLGVVLFEIAVWNDFTDESRKEGFAFELKRSQDLKETLWKQTRIIPRHLGDKYCSAVRACLSEMQAEILEHKLEDQDGLVQGRAYISQVMSQLEEISL